MGYRLTHIAHFFRKIARNEANPGNLRKMIIAMVLAVLLVLLWGTGSIYGKTIRHLDEIALLRSMFYLQGTREAPKEIALIKIDDVSYQKLGLSIRKPFPRETFADALKVIQKDQPKLVILDLVTPTEEGEEVATAKFAEALKLGPSTIGRGPTQSGTFENAYVSDPMIREAAAMELYMVVNNHQGVTYFMQSKRLDDGVVPVEEAFPMLAPLKRFVNENLKRPAQTSLINFYGPAGTIRSHSIWQLFETDRVIPEGFFRDKIVFVGFASELNMRGFSDKEILPVSAEGGHMYGVEIHANVAGNLLDGSWIHRLDPGAEAIVLLLCLFFLILGMVHLNPVPALVFVLGFLAVWFLGTFVLFTQFRLFIPGFLVTLFFSPFIFGGVMCTIATVVDREVKELKKTLGLN